MFMWILVHILATALNGFIVCSDIYSYTLSYILIYIDLIYMYSSKNEYLCVDKYKL